MLGSLLNGADVLQKCHVNRLEHGSTSDTWLNHVANVLSESDSDADNHKHPLAGRDIKSSPFRQDTLYTT